MRKIETPTQINLWDDRFYELPAKDVPKEFEYLISEDSVFMPSATHILDVAYAKGKQFEGWLKDVGHSAKIISEIAAQKGSRVHRACELLLCGEELSYDTVLDVETTHVGKHMGLDEWQAVLRFKEFCDVAQMKDVTSESIVFNKELFYAGTVDILCTIGDERWLIDIKHSNAVYESYFLQVEAYANCVDVDRIGILHLKAQTRGADKRGKKIQGRGWALVEPPVDRGELFKTWLSLLQIYKFKNDGTTPKSITIPKTIKL